MEAAAELVVHAAAGHAGQGVPQHLERARVAGALPDAQDALPRPSAAGTWAPGRGRRRARRTRRRGPGRRATRTSFESTLAERVRRSACCMLLDELATGLEHLAAPPAIGVRDGLQQPREGGHAVAVHRREVGAAVERHAVGREEHGHRPAAPAGHGLHGLHVDLVHVGPLLAIHLDVDEEPVHERGDLVVLERLALHDVTPVAGRVAHREQHRPVLARGPLEGLRAPRVPVHRVVGVLEQVRAGLGGEAIRGAGRGGHAREPDQACGAATNGRAATRAGCSPAPSTTVTAVPGSKCSRRT